MSYTAISDRLVKEKAEAGDKLAHAELVKRGLAGCPAMIKEAGRFVRGIIREAPSPETKPETNPMVTR